MSDTIDEDDDRQLTIVDEALVAGNIANTNGLLVILARLVAKGIFDAEPPEVMAEAQRRASEALAELLPGERTDAAEVKEALRRAVRGYFRKVLDRKPVVLPIVIEM